ncbi:MAG: hypothetical protein HQL99_05205 [Magnetococcales bacterium]|nr:hypothetical protein [Magnetococcales bacterium]
MNPLDASTQSRIQAASQGYMNNFDDVQRGWALVVLLCVLAAFLVGYLVINRAQRLRMERERRQRQQERQAMRDKNGSVRRL